VLEVSYADARGRFAELLDRVNDDREVVRIHRQSGPDAVLLGADEYASLVETAHLLSSSNARRLVQALAQLQAGQRKSHTTVAAAGPATSSVPAERRTEVRSALESANLTAPDVVSRLGEVVVKSWDETVRKLRREHQGLGSEEATQHFRAMLDDVLRSEVDELMAMMGIGHDDDSPLSPGADKARRGGSGTPPPER
jgi:antitoxin YefM